MASTIELKVGRTYRAKKPLRADGRYFNDRTVIHIGAFDLQYDGPAVANGRHCPKINIEKFIAWADKDVTDSLPPGEYEVFK